MGTPDGWGGHSAGGGDGAPALPADASAGGWCTFHPGRLAAGRCAACDTRICADCGSPLTQPGAPPGAGVCPPCAPQYGVPSSVPFEDPALPGWTGFWRTFGWAVGRPGALWRSFPRSPTGRAIAFAYLAALPAAVVNLASTGCMLGLQRVIPRPAMPPAFEQLMGAQTPAAMLRSALLQLVVVYLCTPLIALAWAALHHVPVAMSGGRGGFGATLRATCYLQPLALLSMAAVPCTTLPAWIWYGLVMGGALRRIHGVSGGAALVGAFLPVGVAVVLCCAGVSVLTVLMMGAMQGLG